MNLDETYFLCNEGDIKVLGIKDRPRHEKNCSDLSFLITVLRVGIAAVVNGPVIFMEKGKKVHPRLKGKNLVTRYGFPEGSCVITNKAAYLYD